VAKSQTNGKKAEEIALLSRQGLGADDRLLLAIAIDEISWTSRESLANRFAQKPEKGGPIRGDASLTKVGS
jgi:hypothetical protein